MKQPINDQDIRDRLHAAADRGLSGLRGDPALARRVLTQAKGEKPHMKKKLPVALVAAIIAVSLCTVALAVGVMSGYRTINWKGEVLEEEDAEPIVTPNPEPTPDDAEDALNDHINELANSAADGKAVLVFTTEEGELQACVGRQLERSVPSLEALREALGEASAWLPLPDGLPDGYEARSIKLSYDCYAGHDYTLLSEEQFSDGLVIRRYGLGEGDGFVSGYQIDCRDAEGHFATIGANLLGMSEDEDFSIGLTNDQTFEVLSVPGMDDALYIANEGHALLIMRRLLPDGIEYKAIFAPEDPDLPIEVLHEAHVVVTADDVLSREEMLALFE